MFSLEKIDYHLLVDAERISLSDTIDTVLSTITVEQCDDTVEMKEAIKTTKVDLQQAMARVKANTLTGIISNTDNLRDDSQEYIEDAIEFNKKSRKKNIREAALLVEGHYKTAFDPVNHNNNSQQSVGITTFQELMASTEASQAAQLLRISEDLRIMFHNNNEYIAKRLERDTLTANDNTPRLAPSRRSHLKEIRALESFLEFKARRGNSLHIELIKNLNGPIRSIMATARARETRKENTVQ